MSEYRAPIILPGQVYYREDNNTYLVVTGKNGEMVSYVGQSSNGVLGYRGRLEDEEFINLYQPVDPRDLEREEKDELLSFCLPGTSLKIGYIKEET